MSARPVIEANAHVTLEYVLRGEDGVVLDDSRAEGGAPIEYVHGYAMLVPGLELRLAGLAEGDAREIAVSVEEGFGAPDPELVLEIDASELGGEELAEGDEVELEDEDGETLGARVIGFTDGGVLLDANHPLAGRALRYEVKVSKVRPATEDEIRAAAELLESLEPEEPAPELVPLRRK
jgi:FKBP-type peptidyl-prolyl cis-trans isomerase SlyD